MQRQPAGHGPRPSPQAICSQNPVSALQTYGGRQPAMAQPPPTTHAAPAKAAVTAASFGPPVATQGPAGPSHCNWETHPDSQIPTALSHAAIRTEARQRDGGKRDGHPGCARCIMDCCFPTLPGYRRRAANGQLVRPPASRMPLLDESKWHAARQRFPRMRLSDGDVACRRFHRLGHMCAAITAEPGYREASSARRENHPVRSARFSNTSGSSERLALPLAKRGRE